jgi:release factor glutamine methyltransferase
MGVKIQTIKDIRLFLVSELADTYPVDECKAIADLLISSATGFSKLSQLYDNGQNVSEEQADRIISMTEELKTGMPVQYVLGETMFYNCRIRLNSSTLIPRPETEELVDLILRENKGFKGSVLDFGSGSGCISIALASNLPESSVTGIEISEEAIKIALENASLNKVSVPFIKSDIFSFPADKFKGTGIIVSNPPYVRESEKSQMRRNVLDFEPALALFVPDSDPLVYYKSLIKIAQQVLDPPGLVYFEINEMLGAELQSLVASYGFSDIMIVNDLNDRQRILKCRKNG